VTALPTVIKEMDAHHVERQLRGMPADSFAVAWEKCAAFLDATGMRQRDVHRSHRFLFAASAGTGNAGNAHAQRAAHLPSNALRQRDGHFAADCAFSLDEFCWNIRPGRLQLVAVAHDAAQKYDELPAMLVSRCASNPPVQLSAAEIVELFLVNRLATTSSIDEPS